MPSPSPFESRVVQESRKRDRPPALHISVSSDVFDGDAQYQRHPGNVIPKISQRSQYPEDSSDYVPSRSESATSSLDPYYFGLQSPSDSPAVVPLGPAMLGGTPELYSTDNPASPMKDVASIDRRGLVGVGELTTPRWSNSNENVSESSQPGDDDGDEYEVVSGDSMDKDGSDSPWTIEAIDGDSDDAIELHAVPPLRNRPSIADESGGEEILYPRSANPPAKPSQPYAVIHPHTSASTSLSSFVAPVAAPPSSFNVHAHRARKRSSDEFEVDQSGALISKGSGQFAVHTKDRTRDEKLGVRKHRSLNAGHSHSGSRDRGRDRRRESVGLHLLNPPEATSSGKGYDTHPQRMSTSSSSSSHGEGLHGRWTHTTDPSQLPPSPATSSIQQFLRQSSKAQTANTPPLRESSREVQAHASPNMAHSLLRGTQEGWSGLDDEATAEALRKLDGLVGKTARARASVSSFGKSSSLSRPGTPPCKVGAQWEGIGPAETTKISRRSSTKESADKEIGDQSRQRTIGLGLSSGDSNDSASRNVESSDDLHSVEKTPKKLGATPRINLTPKRGSGSSTFHASTPSTTTSSRDSASMSATTIATSVSASPGRHLGRSSRNSVGSEAQSVHSGDGATAKDRPFQTSDPSECRSVPPVPPLPKDLSTYKSPPPSSAALVFPSLSHPEESRRSHDSNPDRTFSLEVPSFAISSQSVGSQGNRHSQRRDSNSTNVYSPPDSAPAIHKTPSKKWSFSALNIKLTSSPSSKSSLLPMSPRAISFGQQLRRSLSKEQDHSVSGAAKNVWSMARRDAMSSAASLVSNSSTGSGRKSPAFVSKSKTPELGVGSRSGTDSSASTNQPAVVIPQHTPLSPSSSIRRGHSSRRLTPSSIPFFRRSSSQSIQLQPSAITSTPLSRTLSPAPLSQPRSKTETSPQRDCAASSSSVPGPTQKKSSVLSLGFPALLKGSSSRRSLQADKHDSGKNSKEAASTKAAEKEAEKSEKERQRKEDKDRSESRISVLIGRKRGKTLSSTDPKKAKPQVNLPPMQISALPTVTASRVASLKSSSISTPSVSSATPRSTSTSRATAQTVSSMQKHSDPSLRARNQLPTIAGSPSVGTNGSPAVKETPRDAPPALLHMTTLTDRPKETPTKIPRIASRTSAIGTPPPSKTSDFPGNRSSAHITTVTVHSADPSPIPGGLSIDEFGMVDYSDVQGFSSAHATSSHRHNSVRKSPSTSSRVPRHSTTSVSTGGLLHRKANRESLSFTGFRKSSTGSVASIVSVAQNESQHRFSALSPSKLLTPKTSTTRTSEIGSSQSTNHVVTASPSTSRQSLSTPSPVPASVDEEELLGDEEMILYIRRQQEKKLANGATQEELDELMRFPEPLAPGSPSTPASILKAPQAQYLSEYEKKEILDYPSVYYFGMKSKKKMATPDHPSSNYGYDDDRGDYIVTNHDHLAYRYEIIDTLGKGSFGQVLHCRDHCTGESVAIKIIRNKKRFHHQALVEIKILDNLRKWDADEKHHVIKMTEHFYFRNHLCIAMELLSINLYELIKANGFVGFTTTLIRRFTSQMLSSLALMRHHHIVHCDLKPENVLLRHPAKSALKVIDFGSSCFEHERIYTYIQSRFYRSPEVILGMNYHMAIDMWSLGCILAELYTGFPIFPGENEQEQLACIMEVLGVPDKDFIGRSSRKRLFFDSSGNPRPVVNSKGRRRRPGSKTLAQALRCNDEDFVDFIAKCLLWDPERRLKPQAAMRHPFITAGRRLKPGGGSSTTKSLLSAAALTGNRSKTFETPKKSQISAPTPLTARSIRTSNVVPSTPQQSSVHAGTVLSSRSYRASQSHNLSSYHSTRTLNGITTTVAK